MSVTRGVAIWTACLALSACPGPEKGVEVDTDDTDVDELVDALSMPHQPSVSLSSFASAEVCVDCHPDHVADWEVSQHAYAMTDPLFRALSEIRQAEFDGKEDRFCQQCHSSIGTRSGDIAPGFSYDALDPITLEGVTCESCHKVSGLERVRNSGHVLDPDGPMRSTIADPVSNAYHESEHSELHGSSEFCGGCHDVVETDGLDLERPYQEWLESPAAEDGRTCQSCHMPTRTGQAAVDAPEREVHDHTWWTVDLPLSPDFLTEEQYAAKREVVAATLASAASVEVDAVPIWPRGQPFDLFVTVHNLIDGHAFPTGSTFNRQVWLEVVARDAEGTVLFETGTLDDNGDLRNYFSDLDPFGDEDLVLLSSGLTDLHGDPTYLSWTAWEHTSGALSPGYERTWTLFVPTHLAAEGDITIEARLRFRQLPPYLLRAVGLESYIDRLEIFDMASGTVTVELTAE